MRRLPVLLALGLAACSQPVSMPVASGRPAITASARPTEVSSPTQSPQASVAPSANPSPDLPLTPVDFSCRLPAVRVTYPNFAGGFITMPAGSFAIDPRGGFTTDPNSGVVSTVASPSLNGDLAGLVLPFYDAAQARWVPAGSRQSTADGSSYAFATWDPTQPDVAVVHIVDVASASDRAYKVAMPVQGMGFDVADFDSNGVLLLSNGFEQLPEGVWAMDPYTGALRRLLQVGHVAGVRGGYAWAASIDPRDPSPPQLRRSGTASDSIVRVDLRTGASTVWFYKPGKQVDLSGFDSQAHPIVEVYDPNDTTGYVETWLASSPASPVQIVAGHQFLGVPQGDGDRIWFSGLAGVYLYTPGNGLRKVAAFDNLASNQSITVVGVCR
jgi:hypothetical protein